MSAPWSYVRNACRTHPLDIVGAHRPGTLHHIYLISGKLRTGPTRDLVDLAAGEFDRFPGDVPHRPVCLSERVVGHMVTTIPQMRQFGPHRDTTVGWGMPPADGDDD